MPVASAMDGGHRDCPILASVAQWPEIQPLVSRGQIVSAVLPLLTDRQTHRRTTIIGASLSEPHINGTAMRAIYGICIYVYM